jgi:hypothetical protein
MLRAISTFYFCHRSMYSFWYIYVCISILSQTTPWYCYYDLPFWEVQRILQQNLIVSDRPSVSDQSNVFPIMELKRKLTQNGLNKTEPCVCGYVNSQNNRYWPTNKPNIIHEVPLHDSKTGVWVRNFKKANYWTNLFQSLVFKFYSGHYESIIIVFITTTK